MILNLRRWSPTYATCRLFHGWLFGKDFCNFILEVCLYLYYRMCPDKGNIKNKNFVDSNLNVRNFRYSKIVNCQQCSYQLLLQRLSIEVCILVVTDNSHNQLNTFLQLIHVCKSPGPCAWPYYALHVSYCVFVMFQEQYCCMNIILVYL